MPDLSHIDPRSAALLVMNYQVDTLTRFMTAAQSADARLAEDPIPLGVLAQCRAPLDIEAQAERVATPSPIPSLGALILAR
jgi:hypothetical protein